MAGIRSHRESGLTCYDIRLAASPGRHSGVLQAVLDGVPIANTTGRVRVALDGGTHTLLITYIERNEVEVDLVAGPLSN